MNADRHPFFHKTYAMGFDGKIFDAALKSQPSSKRLRWPFGRQDKQPSPLVGWFATGVEIRANMQMAQLANGKYILVENEEARDATQAMIGDDPEFAEIMARHDIKQRWFFRARNKRQAWDKFGRETVA
jgi:hypothetical protein